MASTDSRPPDLAQVDTALEMHTDGAVPVVNAPPALFGAGGPMLKRFDESAASSKMPSQSATPPISVVGIGNKVAKPDYSEAKIVLATVGLPARGKSYLSNKLMRYLKWLEYDVKLRRSRARQRAITSGQRENHNAEYSATRTRRRPACETTAEDSLEMLIQWLKDGGNVGIHGREKIKQRVAREKGFTVSSGDPDYKDMSPEEAKADFLRRIRAYEQVYETITEPHLSYLKIINVHGESQFNVEGKIGGDAPLSERGRSYAEALPGLIKDNIGDAPLTVWTSTLQRTIQTAQFVPYTKLTWKSLDELDAGVCDGMTYEEIEQAYPEDFANRDEDKFNYRYRGGESYRDVVVRLEPVIMELERQENILIIGTRYAYFQNFPQTELPYIKIPLHTVIKLTPKAYGCDEERYTLPIDAVDTHRPKPKVAGLNPQMGDVPAPTSKRQYYAEEGAHYNDVWTVKKLDHPTVPRHIGHEVILHVE
ncbi:histidine phosphatase superfamily [Fomitopsis serialis]|uniref:histidine phosphatase superfamily n=1 Tax=Fomitopsis serialis TaxID=139415 RepID=UPI0020083D3D|nr:histidine phosphatase superfamily [Neoantrodia serialis]KAH9925335.1 histidine phosphatase superfamily [Neoantrodia serialis]